MKILAVDTSSRAASAAIWEDGAILGEAFSNIPVTHSQTILPLTQNLLDASRLTLSEIDHFAVTVGPGSFTGLRIALSAVKGMAFALEKPCIGVSTLTALAYNLAGWPGTLGPVMDARREQVYTALFASEPNWPPRQTMEDCAISIEALFDEIKNMPKPVFLVGDGANLCYNKFGKTDNLFLAPPHLLHQRAAAVAMAAADQLKAQDAVSAAALEPVYLRLSQAERERLEQNPSR